MRHAVTATILALASITTAAPALAAGRVVAGSYAVARSCPGGQVAYRGTLSVRPNRMLYSRSREIAGETFYGTAIEQDGRLAIAYASAGSNGIMQVRRTPSGWEGVWSMYQSNAVCSEVCVPR